MKVYVARFYAVNYLDCDVIVFLSKEKAEAFCRQENEKALKEFNDAYEEELDYDEFVDDGEDIWDVEEAEVEE